MKIAVSACLLGTPCRFDGESRPCEEVIALAGDHELVSVCPETAGGLKCPRPASEIDASVPYPSVRTAAGGDVTDEFLEGAKKTLETIQEEGCGLAILKSNSPSCGNDYVYDGSFTQKLTLGSGIATRLLREEGIRVVNERQVKDCSSAIFATSSVDTPALETERFLLRPITKEDAQDIFEYSKHPDVGPNAGWAPHRSMDDTMVFIEAIASAPHVFGIFEKSTGIDIGSIGLIADTMRKNPDALMLGYALGQPWWDRGYMTEAAHEVIRYGFEDLGLYLITSNHYLFNARSKRVIEKCGFQLEGTLRGVEATPDGIMQDTVCYSLTRQEYFSRKGSK